MDFKKVVSERHSCRDFSTKKVSLGDVAEVIDTAKYAPCAGNIYSVRLILVSETESKIKLMDAAMGQKHLKDASYVIVVCSDPTEVVRSYGTRAEIFTRQQAGAAIENILLSMQNLGLAGSWVGGFDENAVKRIFNIPAHVQVEALIPVGYKLEKEKITELKETKDTHKIFYLEKWGIHYALQTKRIEAL